MYRYARTKQRLHRVHVEGNQTWKVEQCNLDDARYFGLDDEPEPGITHCAYCWRDPAVEQATEKAAQQAGIEPIPALSKRQVPRSLVLLPRRLFALLLCLVAGFFLLSGNASGVILSPDLDTPEPTPDWYSVIVFEVNRQIEDHLAFDHEADHTHAPEVTPSASPSPTSTSIPASPSPTSQRATSPTASPRATPRRIPSPTARPVPPASPSPTPCFRPGKPQSGNDPCQWPPDDK